MIAEKCSETASHEPRQRHLGCIMSDVAGAAVGDASVEVGAKPLPLPLTRMYAVVW